MSRIDRNRSACATRILSVLDEAREHPITALEVQHLTELQWRQAAVCAGHHSGIPSAETRREVAFRAFDRMAPSDEMHLEDYDAIMADLLDQEDRASDVGEAFREACGE